MIPMKTSSRDMIVNVASVTHRSPFRYPGGKTWLVPRIRHWLAGKPNVNDFIEPFAGGGIVSLTVAAEQLAGHVTMVERDEQVAAVWHTIIDDDEGVWLAGRIAAFQLTKKTLAEALAEKLCTNRERAFQTILKNRTYHGGIIANGSAPLKFGENGKGIASRWYAETLKRRILEIREIRSRITFIEGDGMTVIKNNAKRSDAVFFIDPPYTVAGKRAGSRLYTHSELDHEELFRATASVAGDFLMTYDDANEVRALAKGHGFDTELGHEALWSAASIIRASYVIWKWDARAFVVAYVIEQQAHPNTGEIHRLDFERTPSKCRGVGMN